jgi:LSD1 subclass zinc finger protein
MVDEEPRMCESCGAPLEFGYGATVVTCSYCGSSMTLDGDVAKLISKHTMLLNKITKDQAVEAAKKWMDKGVFRVNVASESEITKVELKYMPVWTIPVTLTGRYMGQHSGGYHADARLMSDSYKKKDTKGFLAGFGKIAAKTALNMMSNNRGTRRRGPNYISGNINEMCFELILARRGTTMDLTKYPIPLDGKTIFDLNKIKTQNADILDGDMLENEAKDKAEHTAVDNIKTDVSHKVDQLTRFDCSAEIGEGELIHVPIWFVHYRHKGIDRVAGVEGVSATVVNGDRPTISIGILGKNQSEETAEQSAAPQ